jgi:lipase
VAPDLRGHGRSGWDPPWRIESFVDDVLETVDRVGVREAAWLGHSFGGRLVMEIAARVPERVRRAILLDPAIEEEPAEALVAAEHERADKAYASVDEAIGARLTAGDGRTPREFVEEEMREHLVRSDDGLLRSRYCQSAVVALWGEMATPPPPYERLRAPTLLLYAPASELVRADQVGAYRAALGELLDAVTVSGGHMVLWDAFAETADAVESFLERSR